MIRCDEIDKVNIPTKTKNILKQDVPRAKVFKCLAILPPRAKLPVKNHGRKFEMPTKNALVNKYQLIIKKVDNAIVEIVKII